MKHNGEILKKIISNQPNKVSIADLARKVGYDRTTVYQHFERADLDYSILLKYAKALKYDFTKEFPEMEDYVSRLEEPLTEYKTTTVSDALRERDYWKDKYIRLLEIHNEMIHEQLKAK